MIKSTILLAIFLTLLLIFPSVSYSGESKVELRKDGITIAGTLLVPDKSNSVDLSAMPLAILLSGSGPTDRDGNQPAMKNDSLSRIADRLSESGIASLRYDKRGSGTTPGGDESKLTPKDFTADAVAWVSKMKSDKRFSSIILIGHSEGASTAMLAALEGSVDAVVSISGTGRDLATLLRDQLEGKLPPNLESEADRIIDSLSQGKKVTNSPPALAALFRPSVQPYLIEWMKIDPVKVAAKLNMPLLIIQGDTDIQVKVEDARMLHGANPKSELEIIEGMNHVLRIIKDPQDQLPSYSDPTRPLAPTLVPKILTFIKNIKLTVSSPSPRSGLSH